MINLYLGKNKMYFIGPQIIRKLTLSSLIVSYN